MNALTLSFPAVRTDTAMGRLVRKLGAFVRRSLELSGDAYIHGAHTL